MVQKTLGTFAGTEKQPKQKRFWAGYPTDVQADIRADVPAQKLSPHRSECRSLKFFARASFVTSLQNLSLDSMCSSDTKHTSTQRESSGISKLGISLLRGWVLRELVFRAQQVLTWA